MGSVDIRDRQGLCAGTSSPAQLQAGGDPMKTAAFTASVLVAVFSAPSLAKQVRIPVTRVANVPVPCAQEPLGTCHNRWHPADLIAGCQRLWHVPSGSCAQGTGTFATRVTGIRTCLARDGAEKTATSTEAVNAAVFIGSPPAWSCAGELVPAHSPWRSRMSTEPIRRTA